MQNLVCLLILGLSSGAPSKGLEPLFAAAPPSREFTSPADSPAEFGPGLTAESARDGWLSLFDGRTTYGWRDAVVAEGALRGGQTTTTWSEIEISAVVRRAGQLRHGAQQVALSPGPVQATLRGPGAALRLTGGAELTQLNVKPLGLASLFDGRQMAPWKAILHPRLPPERQARWSLEDGALRGVGGPGAVEFPAPYGELLLQLEIRTRRPLVNGGVFFRSMPGEFMNGYEAQVFNACYDRDPAQPARYSTGAIDDRLLARRLVSRDLTPFVMTVHAVGPHLATWVNGWQTADWTDERAPHENPRQGLRLAPGTIQLQAHDAETDIEFRAIRARRVQ